MTIIAVGYGIVSGRNFVGAPIVILDLNGDGYSFGPTAAFEITSDGAADRVRGIRRTTASRRRLDGHGRSTIGPRSSPPASASANCERHRCTRIAHDMSLADRGNDAAFAKLLVWQDANADGVSDAGELSGLADHGIVSIATGAAHADETIDGQEITARGTFTRADGSPQD